MRGSRQHAPDALARPISSGVGQLLEINRAISESLDFEQTLGRIIEGTRSLFQAEAVALILDERGTLRIRASAGLDPAISETFSAEVSESALDDLRAALDLGDPRSLTASPVIDGGSLEGLLAVVRCRPLRRRDRWLLAGLADQASIALRNARLHRFEQEEYRRERGRVARVGRELSALLDFQGIIGVIDGAVRDLSGASTSALMVAEGTTIRTIAADSGAWNRVAGAYIEHDLLARASPGERWVILPQPDDLGGDRTDAGSENSPSLGLFPVGPADRPAVLAVAWASPERHSSTALEIVRSIADAASVAVSNARVCGELAQSNRMKDEFIATLSHELRNPLHLILGYTEILLRDPLARSSPRILEGLEQIQNGACAQQRLISDLLDLSRLRTGKLEIERRPLDLRNIVARAADLTRTRSEARRLTLDLSIPELPVRIAGDPVRLQQILWNLLDNAIKFTPEGGRVGVLLERSSSEAEIRVEDTGKGIPSDHLERIFDLFQQVDSTSRRQHGGLGIGLALARDLVHEHSGRIEARSEGTGRGSTFVIRFPLLAAEPERESKPLACPDERSLSGLRVLAVDDSPQALRVLKDQLESVGASVEAAADAPTALRIGREEPLDVLVSDLSMPVMDGFDLLRQLRAEPRTRGLPAVALSGFGDATAVRRAREAGYQVHLTKPVALARIVEAVETAIRLANRETPHAARQQ